MIQIKSVNRKYIFVWGILVILICFCFIFHFRNHLDISRNGIQTTGVYVGSKKYLGVSQHYYRFTTKQGAVLELFTEDEKPDSIKIGDLVKLKYLESSPKVIQIVSWGMNN